MDQEASPTDSSHALHTQTGVGVVSAERLTEITAIPDAAIDTSDIPEATEERFKAGRWNVVGTAGRLLAFAKDNRDLICRSIPPPE